MACERQVSTTVLCTAGVGGVAAILLSDKATERCCKRDETDNEVAKTSPLHRGPTLACGRRFGEAPSTATRASKLAVVLSEATIEVQSGFDPALLRSVVRALGCRNL
jgi:hypothetical protein